MDLRKVWERRALHWRDWARTPGHDSYWAYSDSFFENIVPERPGTVLEIGCGEGRVTRSLATRSDAVIAIDTSPTLVAEAVGADNASSYVLGDATMLPFGNESFDTVVAYNSLMDLNDMPQGIAESSRVLKAGGRFCVCILHPLRDAGHFTTEEVDAPFALSNYFESRRYEESFERNGLQMTFTSWHYPLGDYARAFERAQFLIERLTEPLPDPSKKPELHRSQRIPMFLCLSCSLLFPPARTQPTKDDRSSRISEAGLTWRRCKTAAGGTGTVSIISLGRERRLRAKTE